MGDQVNSSPTYTQIFEDFFPYALSIGMTYEQFWKDDPLLVKYYLKAENIRKERENINAYIQGFYFYQAFGCFAEILPAFPPKGAKIYPYPERPIPLTEEQQKAEEERKKAEKMEKMKQRMLEFTNKFNRELNK